MLITGMQMAVLTSTAAPPPPSTTFASCFPQPIQFHACICFPNRSCKQCRTGGSGRSRKRERAVRAGKTQPYLTTIRRNAWMSAMVQTVQLLLTQFRRQLQLTVLHRPIAPNRARGNLHTTADLRLLLLVTIMIPRHVARGELPSVNCLRCG